MVRQKNYYYALSLVSFFVFCRVQRQIILSGDAAGLPQLDKSLQHQMGLPVTLANPFLSISLSHSIDEEQLFKDAPQLMTACGLAMRSRTMTQIY